MKKAYKSPDAKVDVDDIDVIDTLRTFSVPFQVHKCEFCHRMQRVRVYNRG